MTKIVFTGGGSGGHFYPIIAVSQAVHKIVDEERLLEPRLYYFGPSKYDKRALFEEQIEYVYIPAGKLRLYFSLKNVIDLFKTGFGILKAIFSLFRIYPDVIFAKGGYASFPTLFVARILRIPVVIHESDTVPGRVNLWAGKFAKAVAVSYSQVASQFPEGKVAHTGNPIRKELIHPEKSGAHQFLQLEDAVPVILILGGSQGAEKINDAIIAALPRLLENYQIIHQVGEKNLESVQQLSKIELEGNKHAPRYRPFAFLNLLAMRMSAGAADLVITRAGSALFEIASWGVPSIVVPIPQTISRDQRSNAFAYSSTGAAVVIEEANFDDDILISQIRNILGSEDREQHMKDAAKAFAKTDAADKIARKILEIAIKHEA